MLDSNCISYYSFNPNSYQLEVSFTSNSDKVYFFDIKPENYIDVVNTFTTSRSLGQAYHKLLKENMIVPTIDTNHTIKDLTAVHP